MPEDFKDPDQMLAGAFAPRPASTVMGQATATDHSNSYASATMQDGAVVSVRTGRVQQTSNEAVTREANAAANVPWSRAVDARGNHVAPNAVDDNTRITLPGIGEVTVAQARGAGFLPPGWMPNGSYPNQVLAQRAERAEAGQTEVQTQAPKSEIHPDLRRDEFADKAVEADVANLLETTSGLSQTTAVQQLVDNGEIDPATLGNLASELGVEPDAVKARVGAAMREAEKQARAVLSDGGMPDEAILDWARTYRPNQLQLAMRQHATKRQTDGYAALRNDWIESLADHNAEAALKADLGPGITQYMDRGKVIVRLPSGSTITWKNAIRAFGVKKSA